MNGLDRKGFLHICCYTVAGIRHQLVGYYKQITCEIKAYLTLKIDSFFLFFFILLDQSIQANSNVVEISPTSGETR